MVRTTVIPQNTDLHLNIPANYVGKEVEVFLYAKEELVEEKTPVHNNSAKFKGLLSENEALKYDEYLKQARTEWDRDI